MRVGLIGCGEIATRYADAVAAVDGLELAAVADLDHDRATSLGDDRGVPAYDAGATLVERADVDVVCTLTGHGTHAAVTRTALNAGCHVYSEKPLATDAATARDLLALARDRGLGLGCAPGSAATPTARLARRWIVTGRTGRVALARAICDVGRFSEWHPRPTAPLDAGPLRDGAVYPLTTLVACLGAVERVTVADQARLMERYPVDGGASTDAAETETGADGHRPAVPDHTLAVLQFAGGVRGELLASGYVPYRAGLFYHTECHGDAGSLRLAAGVESDGPLATAPLGFARADGPHRPVVDDEDRSTDPFEAGLAAFAERVTAGERTVSGDRAAHVAAVIDAIEAAASGEPVTVPEPAVGLTVPARWPVVTADGPRLVTVGDAGAGDQSGERPGAAAATDSAATDTDAPTLPAVGFGCSGYRGDDTYVSMTEPVATALDAGYRLLDSAELYGNEHRLGEVIARPGSPDREALYLLSKVWNTNHAYEHVHEAFETTCAELGVERLDCYMLHWPVAWAYQGRLDRLRERPTAEADAAAFPTDADGGPAVADVPLTETWAALEQLVARDRVTHIGASNCSLAQLNELCTATTRSPDVVQIEHNPYYPRDRYLAACHDRGIAVMAYAPFSNGVLEDETVGAIADRHDVTPAQVVIRWNVERGVTPIPSSTDPEHIVTNRDVFGFELTAADHDRLAELTDPDYEPLTL